MNKILTTFAVAAGILALASCDEYDDRYTAEYASVVRLEKAGTQELTVWSTYAQTNYEIKILRSGHDIKQASNAILRYMSAEEWSEYSVTYGMKGYSALPSKCITFNNAAGSDRAVVPFVADQIHGEVSLQILSAEVKSSMAGTEDSRGIVIPLVLETDNGSVFEDNKYLILNVSFETPSLSISPAGFEKVFCTTAADPYVRDVTVTLTPDDNPDGFTVKLTNSRNALDSYNAGNGTRFELVKPGALEYSLDGETWSDWADQTLDFPAGVTSKTLKVRMTPSKLEPMDAMALELTDMTIAAEANPETATSIFAVAVKPASIKVKSADATANNDDGTHTVKNLFDGRVTSFYRSQNTPHDGDPVYGSYVDIKLPSALTYFSFDLTSAASSYNAAGNPNVVHVYGSTDGTNWERIAEITGMQDHFNGAGKTATFGNYKSTKPVAYLRWAVIMAGSTGDADLREANTSAYWAATHLKIYGK